MNGAVAEVSSVILSEVKGSRRAGPRVSPRDSSTHSTSLRARLSLGMTMEVNHQ
jgi:hypothetical protein